MAFVISKARLVLQATDSLLERVEAGLARCENCGKRITPWQRVCKWCGYKRW